MKIKISLKNAKASRICKDVDSVFDCIMAITNDIELAMDVQGWSDLASIGESYETEEFIAICE